MQEPTNSEILRAVESIDKKFTLVLDDHEDRIKDAEKYILAQVAVADYVSKNGTAAQKAATPQPLTTLESAQPDKLAKTIATIFAFFTGVIALITYILQLTIGK